MVRRATNKVFSTAALLIVSAAVAACGKPSPDDGSNNASNTPNNEGDQSLRDAVLRDVVDQAISPSHAAFLEKARALETATANLESNDGDLDDARAAWREAMLAWEVVEVFRFGPAGAMGVDAGGMDLRDAIYSWPTTNPCRIDQEIVAQSYAEPATLAAEPVNVRGLDAVEYLLFFTETSNQCDPNRSINSDGSWDALSAAEIADRRAAYAATASALVVEAAENLVDAWENEFEDEFKQPASSMLFGSNQEALNAFSNALFYVELQVKDQKLAEPAGILNCSLPTCPEAREFKWTDENFSAVAANLDGFELAFTGGDGNGFDDMLRELGQEALADDLLAAVATARTAAEEAPPMADALDEDLPAVVDVHDKVKAITDLLKTQFVGVLDLELPMSAEGDND